MSGLAPARLHWLVAGATTLLWLTHLVGLAVLAGTGCAGGGEALLHWFTLILLLPTVALGVASRRRARSGESEAFLADLAVAVAAANAAAIVIEWVPVVLLSACG